MTNTVTLCTPHEHSNPYRESSKKHANWQLLRQHIVSQEQQTNTCTVHSILQNTTWSATDLWKEARLGHLRVGVRVGENDEEVSVLTYFDNVRTQWTTVSIVCGHSRETIVVLTAEEHPELTIVDICRCVEESCGGLWEPSVATAEEWSFLLYSSSEQSLLNTKVQMNTAWWSLDRFAHHMHDYSRVVEIVVYPCEFDSELRHELGLMSNRWVGGGGALNAQQGQQKQQEQTQKERSSLRKEQDAEYYQSLASDRAKAQQVSHLLVVDNASKTDEDMEADVPLTRRQLREARCRFFGA